MSIVTLLIQGIIVGVVLLPKCSLSFRTSPARGSTRRWYAMANGEEGKDLDRLLASAGNITSSRKSLQSRQSRQGGPNKREDAEFQSELERELQRSQLRAPVEAETLNSMVTSIDELQKQMYSDDIDDANDGRGLKGGETRDSIEDAAALLLMLETMREHSAAFDSAPPKMSEGVEENSPDLSAPLPSTNKVSPSFSSPQSPRSKNGGETKSYLTLLNGKKTRDLKKIKGALKTLMEDEEALRSPQILAKCMASLDSCKAHPNELLSWWRQLVDVGGAQVTAKALKSLLAQIVNRKKGDRSSVRKAVNLIKALPSPPHEVWRTTSVNLAIQLMVSAGARDELDTFMAALEADLNLSSADGRAGTEAPPLLVLRSLVPTLQAYGISWGDLPRAREIYSLRERLPVPSNDKDAEMGEVILGNQFLSVLAHHGDTRGVQAHFAAMRKAGRMDAFTFTAMLQHLSGSAGAGTGKAVSASAVPDTEGMWNLWQEVGARFLANHGKDSNGDGVGGDGGKNTTTDIAYSLMVRALAASGGERESSLAWTLFQEWPRPCVAQALCYGMGLSVRDNSPLLRGYSTAPAPEAGIRAVGMYEARTRTLNHVDHLTELANALSQGQGQGQGQGGQMARALLPYLLEGYNDAMAPRHVIAGYLAGSAACHEMGREGGEGTEEEEEEEEGQLLVRSLPSSPAYSSSGSNSDGDGDDNGDASFPTDNGRIRIIREDLRQPTRAFNALLSATATLIKTERRAQLRLTATERATSGSEGKFGDYFDKQHDRSYAPAQAQADMPAQRDGDSTFDAPAPAPAPVLAFTSVHELWSFVRELYEVRQAQASHSGSVAHALSMVDSVTVSALFECIAAHGPSIGTEDFRFARRVFTACVSDYSAGMATTKGREDAGGGGGGGGGATPVLSSWGLHAYLRCHTTYAHASSLRSVLASLPRLQESSREKARFVNRELRRLRAHAMEEEEGEGGARDGAHYSSSSNVGWVVSGAGIGTSEAKAEGVNIRDDRTTDEAVNALIRVEGLGAASSYLREGTGADPRMGTPPRSPPLLSRLKRAALGNCLIYFDRHWRDVSSGPTMTPLLMQDVLSLVHPLPASASAAPPPLNEATPTPTPTPTPAPVAVAGAVAKGGRDITGELAMVTAGLVLAGRESARARGRGRGRNERGDRCSSSHSVTRLRFAREWLIAKWAGLGAVLISRGDHQQAVTMFRALLREADTHSLYSSSEVARAVELAIYSALDGSVPLLTNDLVGSVSARAQEGANSSGIQSGRGGEEEEEEEEEIVARESPPQVLAPLMTNRRVRTLSLLEQPDVEVTYKPADIPVSPSGSAGAGAGAAGGGSVDMDAMMASDGPFAFVSDPASHSGSLTSRLMQIANANRRAYGDKRITCDLIDVLTFLEQASALEQPSREAQAQANEQSEPRAEAEAEQEPELEALPISLPLLEAIFEDALTNKMLAQASRAVKLLQSGWIIDISGSAEGVTMSPNDDSMATRQVELAKKWAALVLAANLNRATTSARRHIRGSISKAAGGAGRRIGGAVRSAVRKAEKSYQGEEEWQQEEEEDE